MCLVGRGERGENWWGSKVFFPSPQKFNPPKRRKAKMKIVGYVLVETTPTNVKIF